jgi:hypothetical protein
MDFKQKNFFVGEDTFRVWLPEVAFIEKSEDNDNHNSRKIKGIMSTQRKDRQGEVLLSKGLDFEEFLHQGHFNDNHSQDTSAIIGYPESVQYHNDLSSFGVKAPGWTCEGYVLKGTKRADAIWELARALQDVPNRKLGFSVEGKVSRREDKTIKEAKIRNVAITNCPVNTDCTWEIFEKSFHDSDMAKSLMAGGMGQVLATESLDSDVKKVLQNADKKKKSKVEALMRAIQFDDMVKAMDIVLDKRQDFDEDTAALFVRELFNNKGKEQV